MKYQVCKVIGIKDGKIVYGPGTVFSDRNKANLEIWKLKKSKPRDKYAVLPIKD